MVKLERGKQPEFWTEEKVQEWTQRWLRRTDWGNWPTVDKERINRVATEAMLQWHYHKCAFCEIQDGDNLQIEHFKSKEHYKSEAFEWCNLFLSCATCNQTKGQNAHRDCLKPDEDDPSEYLWVNPISLKITPKPGIDKSAKERAEYTIKLYGLDRPELSRAYLFYWRKVALHTGPPSIHELRMNNPDIEWIVAFIRDSQPEVQKRTQATEEYSLMAHSLISYVMKITQE